MDKMIVVFFLLLVSLVNICCSEGVNPTCTEKFSQQGGPCRGLISQQQCFYESWSRYGNKYGAKAPITCQCLRNDDSSSHTCQCEYACKGPAPAALLRRPSEFSHPSSFSAPRPRQ